MRTSKPGALGAAWQSLLLYDARRALAGFGEWEQRINEADRTVHLAVLVEPYLAYILEGTKTVESRFSLTKCAPYHRVTEGDIVLLKRSGGDICGVCEVKHVWYYELEEGTFAAIRERFAAALRADDSSFWTSRENAAYATLISISRADAIPGFPCAKKDRRGWAVVRDRTAQLAFETEGNTELR